MLARRFVTRSTAVALGTASAVRMQQTAAPVRRSAASDIPGAHAAAAADERASNAALRHPQSFLMLAVGAATAMWVASVFCLEKSDHVADPARPHPTSLKE